jgi:hypothetical protein
MNVGRNQCRATAILCADWARDLRRRSVWLADVASRFVRRVPGSDWSFEAVLREAKRQGHDSRVLATFDVPLGVPESYFGAALRNSSTDFPGFLQFLAFAQTIPGFFDQARTPAQWSVFRPFFSVPGEKEGLNAFVQAAAEQGVSLQRSIDRLTGAKPLFVKSGIPGSVGSATCALWQELGSLLADRDRKSRVWPFEGILDDLLASAPVTVAEIYPRAAYATALLDEPPANRPRLMIAKTDKEMRKEAVAALRKGEWVRNWAVQIQDSTAAESNEDDFDACFTAAALLRCVLEGLPMHAVPLESPMIEGGMLGTGSVNLALPERTFAESVRSRSRTRSVKTQSKKVGVKTFRCPIPKCKKVFIGSRSGWDGHVGSVSIHPNWHPELVSPADRISQFQEEFPDFFHREYGVEVAGGRATRESHESYDLSEHRHRFAVWAAARAAQRGFTTVGNLRDALDATDLRRVAFAPQSRQLTAEQFDALHRRWCSAICAYLRSRDIACVTYGRAAKLVAVYLKTVVIMGKGWDFSLGRNAHPPIDRTLLQRLAASDRITSPHKTAWRSINWTQLEEADYYTLVEQLRAVLSQEAPFWTIEEFWEPSDE